MNNKKLENNLTASDLAGHNLSINKKAYIYDRLSELVTLTS